MSDQPNAATIERSYFRHASAREEAPTTTTPFFYHLVVGREVQSRRSDRPMCVPTASLLQAYLEQVATGPSASFIEGEFLFIPGTESPLLGAQFGVASLQQQQTIRSQRVRYARLITLIESWLADNSGYDEAVWPRLQARIEESRLSDRKRFSE